MGQEKKKCILVDGSSYLFRAYHALPPLTNEKGMPTGAMYGVINMIRRLLNDEKPDYMAVVFDTKEKTFRHDLYKAYKANRPEMPEDLAVQIQPLHELIQVLGIPLLAVPGFEADDVIGTLAHQAQEEGMAVLISTGDKDLAQLVTPDITLVNTMSNKVMDPQGVFDKFGVHPEQVVDYLALIGDTVDNVPGIPKVGPKTAAKWLGTYETLDNLMAHADDIKGKVGDALRDHIEALPLSKQLVTIDKEVPLELAPESLTLKDRDEKVLRERFIEYGFKTWVKDLLSNASEEEVEPSPEVSYKTLYELKEIKAWVEKIEKEGFFCFDLETTNLDTLEAEIVGVALSLKPFEAAYIPVAHAQSPQPQCTKEDLLGCFKPIWENPKIKKLGQNLKYDIEVLMSHGIEVQGVAHDTMLQSYVVNSIATRHDMDSLAAFYLNTKTVTYEDVAGKGAKQIPFSEVDVAVATQYACEDADITLRLHTLLWDKLSDLKAQKKLYESLEIPLIHVLAHMEHMGVKIDKAMLEKQSEVLSARLLELEEEVYTLAGESFNLGSPKQLQHILFDKLGLPVVQKTPKGQPSTAESVLVALSLEYELPHLILEHRSLSKLKSTYTDRLPEVIHPKTGRVHTSYHQAVTATGRLSSSEPNLQNIPIRTEAGQKIRKAFVAEQGFVMVAADYSQIELRIMAHLSQDNKLCEAFENDQDIHQSTASEIFKVDLDQVSSEQRRRAKAINFGLIYGMSAFGLAKQIGVSRQEADLYIQTYFERYPGVKAYMEKTRESASKKGYVETLLGRRLYLPDINTKNVPRRKAAERTAINAPMQGTAADIIKQAMIEIQAWIESSMPNAKMIMQVHDELVFEIPETELDTCCAQIKTIMEGVGHLKVPLIVSLGQGKNWQEAH